MSTPMSSHTPSHTPSAETSPPTAAEQWADRADLLQNALSTEFGGRFGILFGSRSGSHHGGRLRNTAPLRLSQVAAFNYWWLAHAVEVRVDAAERSGSTGPLRAAQKTYAGIRSRNHGSLFNHYFDDMGWLGLAALRLFDALPTVAGEPGDRYLIDAQALWLHLVDRGWNDAGGPSLAWRTQQLDYKNAPSNGAFALLSARLFRRTRQQRYLDYAERALHFLETTLVDADTGLVADGLNRTGDHTLDLDWRFSYNQGLYIGALIEAFDRTAEPALIERALQTARTTIGTLAPSGVFTGENVSFDSHGGGDIGLFKGIFVRSLERLIEALAAVSGEGLRMPAGFLTVSTDLLWQNLTPPRFLANDTWTTPAAPTTFLATQLSAVLAVEARARFEARVADTR
ncbi:glycoside hydrolase family 76 protein [Subtercola vilae]|uniref:Glycoside hydrolase n=1 Tax=Subtercola vilae TaxID=2056433 RepID=A0A4T2C3W8_9MICO|nr:glycoside hydrolase family 76 protein [Subtercola vilae]TIH37126.1 glycoside hydrolase [Subtercola vilae]